MITNRITALFERKKKDILSVFITAGYPTLHDLVPICVALEQAGADMIEIGMPFSDPLADGPTIQRASEIALANGMSLKELFSQLAGIRSKVALPLLLMGYINPILQFGIEEFIRAAEEVGIDGLILPDLPLQESQEILAPLLRNTSISTVQLVTSESEDARIEAIDRATSGFIYAVSSPAITGGALAIDEARKAYFKRLSTRKLINPVLVGFGVGDRESFQGVCDYFPGAIVGSAFIRALDSGAQSGVAIETTVNRFIAELRGV